MISSVCASISFVFLLEFCIPFIMATTIKIHIVMKIIG
nr:MAG TPA: hypothetical protein [Inoviridae sp.]